MKLRPPFTPIPLAWALLVACAPSHAAEPPRVMPPSSGGPPAIASTAQAPAIAPSGSAAAGTVAAVGPSPSAAEPGPAASAPEPVPAPPSATPLADVKLVRFDEPDSMARLERSRYKVDFFRLANQFESQQNGGFCGIATGVIILNALRVDDKSVAKPRDTSSIPPELARRIPPKFDPFFARYTQGTFMDEHFEHVKPKSLFFGQPAAPGGKPDPGLQLRQLGEILTAHGLDVTIRIVDEAADQKKLKTEITDNLKTSGDYVVVNYFRPALGQPGGGHLSPLGAYDQKSDSFLILDVNANSQHWVWAPAAALFNAMRTRDGAENRGFLLIREKR